MSGHPTVGAVVLAAGMSRRFGSPKQLATLEGRSLLEHALAPASEAGLGAIVVVMPVWLAPPRLDLPSVRWVRNPLPERGLSTSLRIGLASLPAEVGAALILLGDQPGVPASHLEALIAARGGRPVIATRARGVLAPPVLLERTHFRLAEDLAGDAGLRGVMAMHPDLVLAIALDPPPADVDTPVDLPGRASTLESGA